LKKNNFTESRIWGLSAKGEGLPRASQIWLSAKWLHHLNVSAQPRKPREPFRPQPRRRRSPPRPAARAAAAAPPEPARPILLRASVTPGVKVAAAAAARQALASSSYPSSGLRRPPNRYAHPFLFPLCFVNLYSDRI